MNDKRDKVWYSSFFTAVSLGSATFHSSLTAAREAPFPSWHMLEARWN